MPICDHSSECEHEINTPHGVAYNGDVACKYEDVLSVVMQMAMKDAEEQGTVIESMKVHDLSLFVEEDEEEEMGIDTDSEKDNVDEEEDDTTSDEDSDEEEDTDNDDSVTSEPKDVVPENSDTDDDDDDAIVETTEVSIAVAAIKASDHAIPEDSSSEDEADTDDVVPGEDSSSKEDYSPKGIADSTISRSSSHSSLRSTISCDTAYILEHYDAFRKVFLMIWLLSHHIRRQYHSWIRLVNLEVGDRTRIVSRRCPRTRRRRVSGHAKS